MSPIFFLPASICREQSCTRNAVGAFCVLMHQKFAFTTAAMAAALEDTPVSYEDLADIERQFDDAETEISKSSLYIPLLYYRKKKRKKVLLKACENWHARAGAWIYIKTSTREYT